MRFVCPLILMVVLILPLCIACGEGEAVDIPRPAEDAPARAFGVCPPFHLHDEAGNIIDPVAGINTGAPYSPRQTCGREGCHNYEKITEGYHFTQGKGEEVPEVMAQRYAWVLSPGNYGGNWCSPAPLYRQLARKQNTSAREIDMTSFEFVSASCGGCHPGGASLEYDRDGKRYDAWMRNPESGLVSGGENDYDGDYYKARWAESGVIEADCMLCHMPEYDLKKRNAERAKLNYRWAATAGAGFGDIDGAVIAGEVPVVTYDPAQFNPDGTVRTHIVPEPRNETCLRCHFKPDWKKRGAEYSTRTDVHMLAGMRCVDCHSSGSRASDPRISDRENHQFGKGDDPGGWVRNDLNNTVRSCEQCHLEPWRNAPRATHEWLPPMHMDELSCQACHIPSRAVKSALVQASDVYNPAPRISPPGKRIWTFYDQHMTFWNQYGELDLFSEQDKPTNLSRPTLIRYKGKIFPANRVHSTWVGFEEEGVPGLNMLFMKDFYAMWKKHRSDPQQYYPELSLITDDDGNGLLEVNRAGEIDALLKATRASLADTDFPMQQRRLVYVSNDRAYYSSEEFRILPKELYEATPYASVYKFSHDIAPARAALGAGGCTDCHSDDAQFFYGAVLEHPFTGEEARPEWIPNYSILDISAFWVRLGSIREQYMKPLVYFLGVAVVLLFAGAGFRRLLTRQFPMRTATARLLTLIAIGIALAGVFAVALSNEWFDYLLVRRFTLDANHALISLVLMLLALSSLTLRVSPGEGREGRIPGTVILSSLGLAILSGLFMFAKINAIETVTRLSYTTFEAALIIALSAAALRILRNLLRVDPNII
ncbi:MAG: hypothetical protein KFH87_07310 [Bacteroidetes bacterium]|nr:hypothetical protein [Bacteroidota bacterium]